MANCPNCGSAVSDSAKFCGKCGTIYHRSNGKNRWCYWKCYGKQKHICDNVNFTDYQLRVISAHILGTSEFYDEMFIRSIDQIIVLDGGDLAVGG